MVEAINALTKYLKDFNTISGKALLGCAYMYGSRPEEASPLLIEAEKHLKELTDDEVLLVKTCLAGMYYFTGSDKALKYINANLNNPKLEKENFSFYSELYLWRSNIFKNKAFYTQAVDDLEEYLRRKPEHRSKYGQHLKDLTQQRDEKLAKADAVPDTVQKNQMPPSSNSIKPKKSAPLKDKKPEIIAPTATIAPLKADPEKEKVRDEINAAFELEQKRLEEKRQKQAQQKQQQEELEAQVAAKVKKYQTRFDKPSGITVISKHKKAEVYDITGCDWWKNKAAREEMLRDIPPPTAIPAPAITKQGVETKIIITVRDPIVKPIAKAEASLPKQAFKNSKSEARPLPSFVGPVGIFKGHYHDRLLTAKRCALSGIEDSIYKGF